MYTVYDGDILPTLPTTTVRFGYKVSQKCTTHLCPPSLPIYPRSALKPKGALEPLPLKKLWTNTC
jgi:hypothetical protein